MFTRIRIYNIIKTKFINFRNKVRQGVNILCSNEESMLSERDIKRSGSQHKTNEKELLTT